MADGAVEYLDGAALPVYVGDELRSSDDVTPFPYRCLVGRGGVEVDVPRWGWFP